MLKKIRYETKDVSRDFDWQWVCALLSVDSCLQVFKLLGSLVGRHYAYVVTVLTPLERFFIFRKCTLQLTFHLTFN